MVATIPEEPGDMVDTLPPEQGLSEVQHPVHGRDSAAALKHTDGATEPLASALPSHSTTEPSSSGVKASPDSEAVLVDLAEAAKP